MLSRGFAVRLAALLAMSLGLMTVFGGSLAAQDNSTPNAPAADLQLTGVVRTAGGSVLPGSTLRVIQTSTGKAWVSWTDENGKFDIPRPARGPLSRGNQPTWFCSRNQGNRSGCRRPSAARCKIGCWNSGRNHRSFGTRECRGGERSRQIQAFRHGHGKFRRACSRKSNRQRSDERRTGRNF